ncbi:MAG: hypothetical protein RSC08_03745 [Oscillospiraceae bacterium]
MNYYYKVGAGILALCCLAGCGGNREPEHTALVRVLGVDGDEGGITLTAAAEKMPGESGAGGLFTGYGSDLGRARRALEESGERFPATTHTTQLLVGEGTELYPLLRDCVETRETGYRATVWLTEGSAEELIRTEGCIGRLEILEGADGGASCSVLDALAALEEWGRVTLPVLGAEEGVLCREGDRVETRPGGQHGA